MRLDAVTQRHLELVETERTRERAGSLLGTLDRTVTPMGRRMLRGWLLRPLVNPRTIGVRQQIVAELVADAALRAALAERLAAVADLERLAGRASARRASLDDLRALGEAAAGAAGAGARHGRLREPVPAGAGPAAPGPGRVRGAGRGRADADGGERAAIAGRRSQAGRMTARSGPRPARPWPRRWPGSTMRGPGRRTYVDAAAPPARALRG